MVSGLLLLMVTLGVVSAEEVRVGQTICRLSVDATTICLSGELRVTVSVEGKAPVDVDLPRPLTASPDWRVRQSAAKTTSLPEGRERWEQTFYLEPFQTGSAVPLPVQPLNYRTGNEVTDRVMNWKPLSIQVTTEVAGTDLTQARPPTGIEELPPVAQTTFPWQFVTPSLLVVVLIVLSLVLGVRKRRASLALPSARERALADLQSLRTTDGWSSADVERLALIVRQFFEHQLSLAATKQTTGEFLASVRKSGILSDEFARQLEDLLRHCDLVKFAGVTPTADAGRALTEDAHQLISSELPIARPSP